MKLFSQLKVKTKPLIIDQLRAAMRNNELEFNDKTTLREMLTYIVTDTGQMEAEQGSFDDRDGMVANHVHQGAWEPIESTDDYYIEMV